MSIVGTPLLIMDKNGSNSGLKKKKKINEFGQKELKWQIHEEFLSSTGA